jgi:hypothetical protein
MGCEAVRSLGLEAPPLDGEDGQVATPPGRGFGSRGDPTLPMGRGGISGKASHFIDSTPTQPSPIEGEGFTLVELS